MKIELTDDEALVLTAYLHRLETTDDFHVEDPAEEYALLRVQAQLEKTLVQVFDPNYNELVRDARARLRVIHGVIDD